MYSSPFTETGRIHADLDQVKQQLSGKADKYEIHEACRRLDNLEHSLREISAKVDGLRNSLQAVQEIIDRNGI